MASFHAVSQAHSHPDHLHHSFFSNSIMDKMEYMGNTSNDIVVESILGNMSVDTSGETELVSKTCNTDLNNYHDVESTLGNIRDDIS